LHGSAGQDARLYGRRDPDATSYVFCLNLFAYCSFTVHCLSTFPLKNNPDQSTNGERTFSNIVAGSTAVAFGLVFCSLACVGRNANGALDFQWQWTSLIWLAIGAGCGWYFWKLAWWSEKASQPHAKGYFIAFCALLCLLTLYLFVRPLRFVAQENVRDVLVGMGLAIIVLTLFGYMIFTLVGWFSREE
jgi:hypothetical protein